MSVELEKVFIDKMKMGEKFRKRFRSIEKEEIRLRAIDNEHSCFISK